MHLIRRSACGTWTGRTLPLLCQTSCWMEKNVGRVCLYLCQSIISPFFWLFWRKFHRIEYLECRDNRHCIRIKSVVNIFHQFSHILDLHCARSFKNSSSNWNDWRQEMKSSTLSKIRLEVSVCPKIDNYFCQILVIDISKYISLSSFNCKKFWVKRFLLDKVIMKNDFMNKLSLLGSCQQVVMIK